MNTDIRIALGLADHPKTVKLTRKIGESAFRCLIRLWCFAAQNKPSGVLIGMDEMDIAIASGWTGDESEWVLALLSVGFIDREGDVLSLHDWEENNPWAAGAESRSGKAKKAAEARYAKQKSEQSNASEKVEQCYEQNLAVLNANSSTAPFLTLPSQREESLVISENGNDEPKSDFPPENQDPENLGIEEITEAVRLYNDMAQAMGLAKATKLTPGRRSAIRRRLQDSGGLPGWTAALVKLSKTPFCCGENSNGWRADLDFLCQQKSFLKLIEGGYDHGSPRQKVSQGVCPI